MRRLSLTFLAVLALTAAAAAEEATPTLADAAPVEANATASGAGALTDAAVEEEAFEPNTIVGKHIGGDVLVLSVL